MLSLQTELKLAHLLKSIADTEKQVEIIRQVLAEQKDFEPYTAFKRIDEFGLGYIQPADLHQFLKDNDIVVSERDILYLFSLFDTDRDGRMTYVNFLNAIVVATSPSLRQLSTQRETYQVGKKQTLPYEVEWTLARVFDAELEGYRKIELLKDELAAKKDFDIKSAFRTVDIDRLGFLDHESLMKFFQRNKIDASEDDVLALIRRADKDLDGKISYTEFADAIKLKNLLDARVSLSPQRSSYRSVEKASPRSAEKTSPLSTERISSRSPRKTSPRSTERMATQTARKSSPDSKPQEPSTFTEFASKSMNPRDLAYESYLSNARDLSPTKIERVSTKSELIDDNSDRRRLSPIRESISKKYVQELDEQWLNRSLSKASSPRKKRSVLDEPSFDKSQSEWSPTRSRISVPEDKYRTPKRNRSPRSATSDRMSPLKGNEEEVFARTLKNHIELDQEVEELRNELALRSDFNLLDAFKVFDLYEKGNLTPEQFEDGLALFGVYPTKEELKLVVQRYDKDNDGLLR